MSIPKLSVLLPFYNAKQYFSDAIDSVLTQEGVDFELVLVNNNSDSDSCELAKSFERTYTNVLVVDEPQQGIAFALNAGLNHCKGKYIARMDADDLCLPGRLKLQSEYLDKHTNIELVSGLVKPFGMEGNNEGMLAYVSNINKLIAHAELYHHRFVESPFAHPSVMFRKSVLEQYGNYSTDNIPEDFELWLRWLTNGVKMGKVNHEVILWRDHDKRLSRKHANYSPQAFDKVRTTYLLPYLHKINKPIYIWGGGKLSRKKTNILEQMGIVINGFIDVDKTRKIQGYEVIHYLDLPPPGNIFIVPMVSNRGKVYEIKEYLEERGYVIETDFLLCV